MNRYIKCLGFVVLLTAALQVLAQDRAATPLIIDMHLHALKLAGFGVGGGPVPKVCSSNENIAWNGWDTRKPFTVEGSGLTCVGGNFAAASTDHELMSQTLAALQRYNIRAVTSGPFDQVAKWRTAAPNRIIPATPFKDPSEPEGQPVSELRRLVGEGKIAVFAEVGPQYGGMSPTDPALEPY
jgi:hypothetical protein